MTLLVWKREMALFKKNAPGTIIPGIMLPLIMIFALGKILGGVVPYQSNVDYFTFAASGIVVITMMTTSTFVSGFDYLADFRITKNIEELLTSPIKIWQIILGKALGITTKSLVGSIIIYIISILLGADIFTLHPIQILAIIPLFFAGLFFGMFTLTCALVAPNHDAFAGMLNLVVMPLMFFSETFFSKDIIGRYSWILNISPLYHMVKIFRDISLYSINTSTMISLLVIVLLTLFMLASTSNLLKQKLIN